MFASLYCAYKLKARKNTATKCSGSFQRVLKALVNRGSLLKPTSAVTHRRDEQLPGWAYPDDSLLAELHTLSK